MYKSFKVMLHPNNKQRTKLFQCFGVSRFTYNWALGRQQENHNNGGKFISAFDLEKEFVQLKKLPEYTWLNMFSSYISNMAIIDACTSYKNFFNVTLESISDASAIVEISYAGALKYKRYIDATNVDEEIENIKKCVETFKENFIDSETLLEEIRKF